MHYIAKRCVAALVEQGYLDKARTEWYVYAIERRLGYCLAFVWLVAVGLILHAPLQTLLFFCSAVFLRARTGGWHASTSGACQVLSFITTTVVVWAVCSTPEQLSFSISLAIILVCVGIVFFFAPVNNANIYLTAKELKANRILSRYRLAILCVLCVGIQVVFNQSSLGLSIAAGMAAACMGVMISYFKKEDIIDEA